MTELSSHLPTEGATPDTEKLLDATDIIPEFNSFIADPQVVKLAGPGDEHRYETFGALGSRYVRRVLELNRIPASTRGFVVGGVNLSELLINARKEVAAASELPQLYRWLPRGYYDQMPDSLREALGLSKNILPLPLLSQLSNAPDKVLSEFLLWNNSHINAFSLEMQPLLNSMKLGFTQTMQRAIRRGLPLSRNQLDTRLNDSTVIMVDPVNAMLESLGGYYTPNTRTIKIAANEDAVAVRHVGTHELLHLVSGAKIETHVISDDDIENPKYPVVEVSRCGLASRDGSDAPLWINEAITEQLTLLLLYHVPADFRTIRSAEFFSKKEGPYQYERGALAHLLGDDVPIYDMLAAYFEDTTPQNEGELPSTAAFWQMIEKKYGEGVFNQIASVERIKTREQYDTFVKRLRILRVTNGLTDGLEGLLKSSRPVDKT